MQAILQCSAHFRIRPPSWIWLLWRIGVRKLPRYKSGKNGQAGRRRGRKNTWCMDRQDWGRFISSAPPPPCLWTNPPPVKHPIDQFQYIKIQLKTIDFRTRLWEINTELCGVYSPEPRTEVYCAWLNFNISKLAYYTPWIDGGIENLIYLAFGSKITPALQARYRLLSSYFSSPDWS